MAERMTFEEIERSFPGEWVVVRDFVPDDSKMIRDGVLVGHTSDRAEAHRLLGTFEGGFAIWWTGPFSHDFCGHLHLYTKHG
ncbi:MAG: hypothetical protein HY907_09995 [Deltaproteobacteria bacterium]|nr:hypothetical protein [Deltaproteobacteria bacterium]